MEKRIYPEAIETIVMPEPYAPRSFNEASEAVAALRALYERNTAFLRDSFSALASGGDGNVRYRAFYPAVSVTTTSFTQVDSRQAYGHMPTPGTFTTTITRPDLFREHLTEQLRLIMRNHGVPVTVSESDTPIPRCISPSSRAPMSTLRRPSTSSGPDPRPIRRARSRRHRRPHRNGTLEWAWRPAAAGAVHTAQRVTIRCTV